MIVGGPTTMPSTADGWWETERAVWIRERVIALSRTGSRIIDIGCGRGRMFADPRLTDRFVVRVDSHIWDEWGASPGIYVCAHADALPFRDGSFDVIGSFDVLEHLADDRAAFSEQLRLLSPSGTIVAAVPADPRLWSSHDDAVGHHRRYTAATLQALATSIGVRPTRTTYFFSYLWAPARLLRSSKARRNEGAGPSHGLGATFVRWTIHLLSSVERAVMRRTAVPFGTSLWMETEFADIESHKP